MEDLVVENLFNGNRELQIQAATQLSKLGSKQRHKLAETGIISPLISMLQSQDFEAIEASLLALLGLAFGSERFELGLSLAKSNECSCYLNNFLSWVFVFFVSETKSGL